MCVVLLTGRWVSTLPFLQSNVINGDVPLNARATDAFQNNLRRARQLTLHSAYIHGTKKTKTRIFAIKKNQGRYMLQFSLIALFKILQQVASVCFKI